MSITLRINSRGADDLSPNFKAAIRRANIKSAGLAVKDARLTLRRRGHIRTGKTERSTTAIIHGSDGWSLVNDEAPALYLEGGTDPHPIDPQHPPEPGKKAYLFWRTESGFPIFARHVDHLGQRADPFMQPAIEHNKHIFERFLAEEIEGEWRRA